MTGRRIVKYRPQEAMSSIQSAPRLPTILEETSVVEIHRMSPHHSIAPSNGLRIPPAATRETLLQQIAEIRTGLAEIQEISKRIDATLSINNESAQ